MKGKEITKQKRRKIISVSKKKRGGGTYHSKTLSESSSQTELASLNVRDDSSDDANDVAECENTVQGYLHFVCRPG